MRFINNKISDAVNAINVPSGNVELIARQNTFDRNITGIYVNNQKGNVNILSPNNFTCTSNLNKIHPNMAGLETKRSFVGIRAVNSIGVIDNVNVLEHLNGIIIENNSEFSISNSTFTNIHDSGTYQNFETGIGITGKKSYLYIAEDGLFDNCGFWGIKNNNCTTTILNQTMENIGFGGIFCEDMTGVDYTRIERCTLQAITEITRQGIDIERGNWRDIVNNNYVDFDDNGDGISILVSGLIPTQNEALTVSNNKIYATNSFIQMNLWNHSNMVSNNNYVEMEDSGLGAFLVNGVGIPYNNFSNVTYEFNYNKFFKHGFIACAHARDCIHAKYCSNQFNDSDVGMSVQGPSEWTKLSQNYFNSNRIGLFYSSNTISGPQIVFENLWENGTFGTTGARHFGNIDLSLFHVNTSTNSNFRPTNPIPNEWFIDSERAPLRCAGLGEEEYSEYEINVATGTYENQVSAVDYFQMKRNLYHRLSILPYNNLPTVFQDFIDRETNTNVGILFDVYKTFSMASNPDKAKEEAVNSISNQLFEQLDLLKALEAEVDDSLSAEQLLDLKIMQQNLLATQEDFLDKAQELRNLQNLKYAEAQFINNSIFSEEQYVNLEKRVLDIFIQERLNNGVLDLDQINEIKEIASLCGNNIGKGPSLAMVRVPNCELKEYLQADLDCVESRSNSTVKKEASSNTYTTHRQVLLMNK